MTQDEAPYSGRDTPNEKAPDFHPGLFAMKMAHQAGFEPTTPPSEANAVQESWLAASVQKCL